MGSKMCVSGKRPQPTLRRAGLQWVAEALAFETIVYVRCEKSCAGNCLRHGNNLSVYPLSEESPWAVIFPGNILKWESSQT